MNLWRISHHGDLIGLGGERSDGRWHTAARGKRIVYLSEHPALALIEALVNLKGNPALVPDTYQLMKVTVPPALSSTALAAGALSENWRTQIAETQRIGDAWLANGERALMAVPSAPSPESFNYLLNPLHRDARGVAIEWHTRLKYDQRLFRLSAGAGDARVSSKRVRQS